MLQFRRIQRVIQPQIWQLDTDNSVSVDTASTMFANYVEGGVPDMSGLVLGFVYC